MTSTPVPEHVRLWLFDLDGVLTNSAVAHASAWKAMFDDYLSALDPPQSPFDDHEDYLRYVDGRPRDDGVRTFLASRNLSVDDDALAAMGDRKTQLFVASVERGAVSVYPDALVLVNALEADGRSMAVVSSSANARMVLEQTGLIDHFELVIDGAIAAQDGLAGKPAPDTYVAAAQRLGGDASVAVVLEDATVGVQAGRAGAFGLVVGVDRTGSADALSAAGADVVVQDLGTLAPRRKRAPGTSTIETSTDGEHVQR